MDNFELKVLENAIETFGKIKQLTKAVEELAELQKEICKTMLNQGDLMHLAEEVADVEIMIAQIKLMNENDFLALVEEFKESKIERLKNKLKEGEMLE